MSAPTNQPIALDQLPNMGKTTVMWLRAIGIRDSKMLRERGIFWAYQRMRARRFRVTTAVLFSLEGALQDRPWRSFSDAEKDLLLRKLAHFEHHADPAARPVPQAAPRKKTTRETKLSDNKSDG